MVLHLIGIGLCGEKDLSVRALECVRAADVVYVEGYTSVLQVGVEELERFYGRMVKVLGREAVESGLDDLLEQARQQEVALLVVGDCFGATTHAVILAEARRKGVQVRVLHGASILTAVGVTGLELYKFGKVTSIPFRTEGVGTPYEVLASNHAAGLHTLMLLDLDPGSGRFLSVGEAARYLLEAELRFGRGVVSPDSEVVGCARLGCPDQVVRYAPLRSLAVAEFGAPPYCLIVPGRLHFVEEEVLALYRG
ncbi:MAG: diphthine synthase [Nitrosarchaeum sp.]|nr:diphthine synthase [Nitrosarchaeum sp.]